ncbi:hypothetical protein SLEP1_g35937 [Rubroshorea leprosula]|uniref:Uncharacterized protein n=1 Tax=Rubroshorea leprosula TaxID=152421 RepID=A0AAV5KPZ9_9ROSI|nr:hypothetical protein SLEP1_g35937 [Rubroshorea leprosula]
MKFLVYPDFGLEKEPEISWIILILMCISGDSSSIPSEPPDIRNWFSSYKHESFVLDTYHDFGNYVSRDSESNKDRFVSGENKSEKEENLIESVEKRNGYDSCEDGSFQGKECLNQSLSEIPNSLESASLVSETGLEAMYMSLLCWTQVMISRAQLTTKQDVRKMHLSLETASKKKLKMQVNFEKLKAVKNRMSLELNAQVDWLNPIALFGIEKMMIDPYVRSWTLIIHHLAFLLRQYSSDKLFSGWNQNDDSSRSKDTFYILFTCSKKTLGECKGRTVA